MGNLPEIATTSRFSIEIPSPVYLRDHLFREDPVFPAVEAMETLSREVNRRHPGSPVTNIGDARFDKFLFIPPEGEPIPAFLDLQVGKKGDLEAKLITRSKAGKTAITRTKVHASLTFLQPGPDFPPPPLDIAAAPEGICARVSSGRIYEELVPFGSAYRNIQGSVWLSPDGALAEIRSPAQLPGNSWLLGSPFVLDAAFHAACVWGQHYGNVVAFPVYIEHRKIYHPCSPDRRYFGRILPKSISPDLLVFDIWVLDENGVIHETAQGVRMRDVSGGQIVPPAWITRHHGDDPLAVLRDQCKALSVIELDATAPFAEKILSNREQERFNGMGARRRNSYLAGRLALKRLFRSQVGNTSSVSPWDIETFKPDSGKPHCRHPDYSVPPYYSLSHDQRFAVAVSSSDPVGVDVELISDKAMKSGRLFMDDSEHQLVSRSELGPEHAALRVWSAKEAVAKALDIGLADAWQRVRLLSSKEKESRITIDGNGPFTAVHTKIEDHLFTLFTTSAGYKKTSITERNAYSNG